MLKIDEESTAPTKIKSIEDANKINSVSSSSQSRKTRDALPIEAQETPKRVIEQGPELPIRKKKPKQVKKQTSTPELPQKTITRSGRQAKPKKMFGESINLSPQTHSTLVNILQRQMILSHQIKMML